MIQLLVEFDKVCTKHKINYFVFGGTMIGAIRHRGFIPWDDDVDVIVPRKDYDLLKKIAYEGAFHEPYFFQDPRTDEGYPKGFARLRDSGTTEIPYEDFALKCNSGIYIDIFPLDILPDDKYRRKAQKMTLKTCRHVMNLYARYYSGIGNEGMTRTKRIVYNCILPLFKLRIITMNQLYEIFENVARKYSNSNSKMAGALTLLFKNDRFIYDRCLWQGETIRTKFEDIEVPVPEKYDDILKHSYGDYMTPVHEPTNHGDLVFSTTMPYPEYINANYSELKKQWYLRSEVNKHKA